MAYLVIERIVIERILATCAYLEERNIHGILSSLSLTGLRNEMIGIL